MGTINEEVDLSGINVEASVSSEVNVSSMGIGGPTGPQGAKGDKGDTGAQGEKGEKGDPGATGSANTLTIGTVAGGETAGATITGVAPNQVLNLILPKGNKGDTGASGADGADGKDGAAATVTVGTTTTLPPGSSATVNNSGTSSDAVLNFGIPKGETVITQHTSWGAYHEL